MSSSAGPTRRRADFHHGDLANALVVEARRLVRAQGAEAFSLREAARAVGVSANATYRHYRDKDALLAAVARAGFTQMAMEMEVLMKATDDDPVARLKSVGGAYLAFAAREPSLFALMFGPWGAGGPTDVAGVGERTGLTPAGLLSQALDDLVEAGRIEHATRANAEVLLWPAVHGLAVLSGTTALAQPRDQAYAHMFALMMKALLSP